MTPAAIATLLHARRVGRDKWMAHCPGPWHKRGDRSESLSIAAGDDGRTLIHCFCGCSTEAILQAVGLRMADLFARSPPSLPPEQQAALDKKREEDEWDREYLHNLHGKGCDKLHSLQASLEDLAYRLIEVPDAFAPHQSPGYAAAEADPQTIQYHETLDEIRRLESILIGMEKWWF